MCHLITLLKGWAACARSDCTASAGELTSPVAEELTRVKCTVKRMLQACSTRYQPL